MQPKEALIGGSINLGNYESFKFEFRGIVEKPEDYLDLAAFAAGSLLSQGATADPEVRGKIRGFVGKVFGLSDEKVPDVRVAPQNPFDAGETPHEPPADEALPAKVEKRDRYDTGFPDKPLPKRETKAWSGGDARPLKMEEKPAPEKKQPDATPASKALAAYTCEACGKDITATQKQMSQLFLNKTLCKACMDAATKGGSA